MNAISQTSEADPHAWVKEHQASFELGPVQEHVKGRGMQQTGHALKLFGRLDTRAVGDPVEVAWSIIDPILAAWQSPAAPPLETYPTGDWGPVSSDDWMKAQGREWFDVCPVLH